MDPRGDPRGDPRAGPASGMDRVPPHRGGMDPRSMDPRAPPSSMDPRMERRPPMDHRGIVTFCFIQMNPYGIALFNISFKSLVVFIDPV